MDVIALVGPSGTGKSHRALLVAHKHQADAIIDDGILIKDGKIDHMIKPVSLVGYGYEILKRITMVGNDLGRAPGVCGAESGSCYVEVGQPTLLISSMLVGGKGGN